MREKPRPRVLLVDDNEEVLRALRQLLQPCCEVVGSVTSASNILDEIANCNPSVVVLDLNMPGVSGIDACRLIRKSQCSVSVVVLTASSDESLREEAMRAGASAFVLKRLMVEQLAKAIEKAAGSD